MALRQLLYPWAGQTDANGAFSQDLTGLRTGETFSAKISGTTSGPAEWAILLSGQPVNFGRGRRVTLGPELWDSNTDVLTISVTGAPPKVPVSGTVSGLAGDPDSVTSRHAPQPNTIALDTTAPRQKLWPDGTAISAQTGPSFTVAAAGNVTKTFTLPTGNLGFRIGAVISGGGAGAFQYAIFAVGVQTGMRYYPSSGVGQPVWYRQPITIPIDPQFDTSVSLQISGDASNALDIFVAATPVIEAVETYSQQRAMPWQYPTVNAVVANVIAAGATAVIVAAFAGPVPTTVWLFTVPIGIDAPAASAINLEDTNGGVLHQFETGATIANPFMTGAGGSPQVANAGIQLHNISAGSLTLRGSVNYTPTTVSGVS